MVKRAVTEKRAAVRQRAAVNEKTVGEKRAVRSERTVAAKRLRERDVERHLVRRVGELGGMSWKWQSPSLRGVPDRIVTLRGVTVAVECKAPGHKPTAYQARMHARLRQHGWRVEVVDRIEAVEALLRAL